MKYVRTGIAFLSVFGGFSAAFGLTTAGNPVGGGLALIGLCFLGAFLASR